MIGRKGRINKGNGFEQAKVGYDDSPSEI